MSARRLLNGVERLVREVGGDDAVFELLAPDDRHERAGRAVAAIALGGEVG